MVSAGSVQPVIGADCAACGVADSGMWPSPAISPEVASSPTQPAPGRNTSAHACRSVKSSVSPAAPAVGPTSGTSWTR